MSTDETQPEADSAYDVAVEDFRGGRVDEAARRCRTLLARRPNHAGAAHLLGVIHQHRGEHEQAVEFLGRVTAQNNASALVHVDLGNSLDALGRSKEATACYARALSIDGKCGAAYVNLANAYQRSNRLVEAIDVYRQALGIDPGQPRVHSNLGNALRLAGQFDQAIAACKRAIELDPSYAGAHVNLGAAVQAQGRDQDAAEHYKRAVALDERNSQALSNLGMVHQARGRLREAQRCYRSALDADPRCIDAIHNLGLTLRATGRMKAAESLFRRGLELDPNRIELHNALGNLYKRTGALDRAVRCYRRALELDGNSAETISNLGTAYLNLGRFNRAVACCRKAMALKPSWAGAASNLLFARNYDGRLTPPQMVAEHRRWARMYTYAIRADTAHGNDPAPHRALRVGYVSPDFRRHPVAFFMLPILNHHDPRRVLTYGYAELEAPDAVSRKIRGLCHAWRPTRRLDDERVAQMVRDDRIDILVDLAGHTANNRLLVFAHKPAPVQVTWLGYPNTSGMEQIDYRLSDEVADPPGACTGGPERLVYLEQGVCCFTAPHPAGSKRDAEPAPGQRSTGSLPARRAGHVTFGSLNNGTKLNRGVIDLWCRVLGACPTARLLLLRDDLRGSLRMRIARQLHEGGVTPDRFDLHHRLPAAGRTGRRSHLDAYDLIDIALDCFPWNGHATTCEALWMGVPVVTLAGDRYAGRMAASVLHRIGRDDLVATDPDAYVRIACDLANDLERLSQWRSSLRPSMQAAPLCDGAVFTAGLEEAYRQMWVKWCGGKARRHEGT